MLLIMVYSLNFQQKMQLEVITNFLNKYLSEGIDAGAKRDMCL